MYKEKFNLVSLDRGLSRLYGYGLRKQNASKFCLAILPAVLDCTIADIIPILNKANDLTEIAEPGEYYFPFKETISLKNIYKEMTKLGIEGKDCKDAFITFMQNCFLVYTDEPKYEQEIYHERVLLKDSESTYANAFAEKVTIKASHSRLYSYARQHKLDYYDLGPKWESIAIKIKTLKEAFEIGKKYGMTYINSIAALNTLFDFPVSTPVESFLIEEDLEKLIWVRYNNNHIYPYDLEKYFNEVMAEIKVDGDAWTVKTYLVELFTVMFNEEIANKKFKYLEDFVAGKLAERTFNITPELMEECVAYVEENYNLEKCRFISLLKKYFGLTPTNCIKIFEKNETIEHVFKVLKFTPNELYRVTCYVEDNCGTHPDKVYELLQYISTKLFPGAAERMFANLDEYNELYQHNVYISKEKVETAIKTIMVEYITDIRQNTLVAFATPLFQLLFANCCNSNRFLNLKNIYIEELNVLSELNLFTTRNFLISKGVAEELAEECMLKFFTRIFGTETTNYLFSNLYSEKYETIKTMFK